MRRREAVRLAGLFNSDELCCLTSELDALTGLLRSSADMHSSLGLRCTNEEEVDLLASYEARGMLQSRLKRREKTAPCSSTGESLPISSRSTLASIAPCPLFWVRGRPGGVGELAPSSSSAEICTLRELGSQPDRMLTLCARGLPSPAKRMHAS